MPNTYNSAAEAEADRAQMRRLLTALDAWDRALRRDECAAWAIMGTRGRIYSWGDGHTWVIWVKCRSVRHWTATKQRLGFCTVVQDGDDGGCLRLHLVPSSAQAEAIREVLGIRKRREVSDEERVRLGAYAFKPGAPCTLGSSPGTGDNV